MFQGSNRLYTSQESSRLNGLRGILAQIWHYTTVHPKSKVRPKRDLNLGLFQQLFVTKFLPKSLWISKSF